MMNLQALFETRLPTLNQGQMPTCVFHTRANMTNAFMRLYEGKSPSWGPDKVLWANDGACDYKVSTPLGEYTVRNGSCDPGWVPAILPEQIKRLIMTNGVVEVSVPGSCRTFAQAWSRRKNGKWLLPVIKPAANNGPSVLNHDIFALGVRKDGPIIMNSWGTSWGKRGLAVLSWDFIQEYGVSFLPYAWNGHPLGGVTLPKPG